MSAQMVNGLHRLYNATSRVRITERAISLPCPGPGTSSHIPRWVLDGARSDGADDGEGLGQAAGR
jgi:hypothetical protein